MMFLMQLIHYYPNTINLKRYHLKIFLVFIVLLRRSILSRMVMAVPVEQLCSVNAYAIQLCLLLFMSYIDHFIYQALPNGAKATDSSSSKQ